MILRISIIATSLFLLFIIPSCEYDVSLKGKPVNSYGGNNRSNSYEQFGDFSRQLFYVDNYKSEDSSGAIGTLLVLSSQQIVFPTINGSIILLDNKNVVWIYKMDSNSVVATGMAADQEQNIYAIANTGILYSLSISGELRWKKTIPEVEGRRVVYSNILALSDGIVVAASNGKLVKYSFEGEILWIINNQLPTTKSFPADDNGNIAFPITHNKFGESDTLLFLSSDGKVLWKKIFHNLRIIKSPVIKNGVIYISGQKTIAGKRLSLIISLDSTGKEKWRKELAIVPHFISIDNDGNLYIAAYNSGIGKPLSMVLCLNDKAEILWKKYFEVTIPAPIMISREVMAFVGVDERAYGLFFIRKNGLFEKSIPLNNAPSIRLEPVATPTPDIIFAGADKLQIIRIDETPMEKVLFW